MIPKIIFCNKCHQRVKVPIIASGVKVQVETGFITLECKCGQKMKLKTKKQEA